MDGVYDRPTFVWRIRSKKDPKAFYSSGRGLYAKNGRSIWARLSGAVTTFNNLSPEEQADAECVQYVLVENGVVRPDKNKESV